MGGIWMEAPADERKLAEGTSRCERAGLEGAVDERELGWRDQQMWSIRHKAFVKGVHSQSTLVYLCPKDRYSA